MREENVMGPSNKVWKRDLRERASIGGVCWWREKAGFLAPKIRMGVGGTLRAGEPPKRHYVLLGVWCFVKPGSLTTLMYISILHTDYTTLEITICHISSTLFIFITKLPLFGLLISFHSTHSMQTQSNKINACMHAREYYVHFVHSSDFA
jgi:hypothetical protein